MTGSSRRKLTARQTAVLAALERRGEATLLDLRGDFPDLAPSVVARVLDVLVDRGLVRRTGDPGQIYLGGVFFWAASRTPPDTDAELDAIRKRLKDGGWDAWADSERGLVVVLLPIVDVHEGLVGMVGNAFDRLGQIVSELVMTNLIASTSVSTEISVNDGTPALQVELRIQDGE